MSPEQTTAIISAIGTLVGAALLFIWKSSQMGGQLNRSNANYEAKYRQQQGEIQELRGHNKLLEGRLMEQRETYSRQIELLMGRVLQLERDLAQTQEHEKLLSIQLTSEQEKSALLRQKLELLESKS